MSDQQPEATAPELGTPATDDAPRTFTATDGPAVQELGFQAIKQPNPVYMTPIDEAFAVETDSGTMTGTPGDFLVFDPISGHVWPISAEYQAQHYETVSTPTTGTAADSGVTVTPDTPPATPRVEDNPDITVTPAP